MRPLFTDEEIVHSVVDALESKGQLASNREGWLDLARDEVRLFREEGLDPLRMLSAEVVQARRELIARIEAERSELGDAVAAGTQTTRAWL